MAITDRNLVAGTRLEGTYKKERQICVVEASADGKLAFVLDDGRRFKSVSPAASAVMGGMAVNGWLFWRPAGQAPEPDQAPVSSQVSRKKRMIYRLPSQKGVAEGHSRWVCATCRKSFVVEGEAAPLACPVGHRGDDQEGPSPLAATEATEARRG